MTVNRTEQTSLVDGKAPEVPARLLKVVKGGTEHAQARICLWFSSEPSRETAELTRTLFMYSPLNYSIQAVRGRFSGAYPGASTFQWTSAVQALAVALTRAAARRSAEDPGPLLSGRKGTLASSLDDALYKQTSWLCDLFGADTRGQSLANKLFKRTNPGKKQAGPVSFSLNRNVLPAHAITVLLDSVELTDATRLESLASSIEAHWTEEKAAKAGVKAQNDDSPEKPRVQQPVAAEGALQKERIRSVVFLSPAMESKPFYADALEKVIIGVSKIKTGPYVAIPKLPSRSFDKAELWSIFDQIFLGHISCDGVIFIPDDPDLHRDRILEFWKKKDIPLVLFDVDMNRTDLVDGETPPFVGADELHGGAIAGELLVAYLEKNAIEKPEVLVLAGASTSWERRRIEGFRQKVQARYPNVVIYQSEDLFYERQRAFTATYKMLRKLEHEGVAALDCIFACNDDMALGARSAIIQAEREGLGVRTHIKIVGYDAVKEMRNYIDNRDKWILGTVDVKLEDQIDQTLKLINRMIEGQKEDLKVIAVEPCAYAPMRCEEEVC